MQVKFTEKTRIGPAGSAEDVAKGEIRTVSDELAEEVLARGIAVRVRRAIRLGVDAEGDEASEAAE